MDRLFSITENSRRTDQSNEDLTTQISLSTDSPLRPASAGVDRDDGNPSGVYVGELDVSPHHACYKSREATAALHEAPKVTVQGSNLQNVEIKKNYRR